MTDTIECCNDILSVKGLTSYVRQCVKNIIEKEGYTSYKIDLKDISTNGANYLGTLQTISIKGKLKDGKDKDLNLFLKNSLSLEGNFTLFDASMVYFREGFIYNDLLKVIEKIEDKYKIPQEERFNAVASYSEPNDKVIILEDLTKLGFITYDKTDVVSIKFAELAIEQLAKFHAMSFIIKNEHPEYFENKIKSLHTMFHITNDFKMHIKRSCDKAMETLEGDAKAKFDKYYPKMMEKLPKHLDVSADDAVCLIHGDFKPNNILMKEIDGEISKVILIDYQLSQFGYPVTDLSAFICLGTDQKFRNDHLENLKNLYYSTFVNFLSKFNIEAEGVYSRKQFEEEYRDKMDYGFITFFAVMPFLFAKPDDVPSFENGLQSASYNMEECYKDRLHGLVDDFIKWGYF